MFTLEFLRRRLRLAPVETTSSRAAGASEPMPTFPPSATVSRVPPALFRYRLKSRKLKKSQFLPVVELAMRSW